MHTIAEYLIPSLIILIANIFSGEHGSKHYEFVTAVFGWIAAVFLGLYITMPYLLWYFPSHYLENIQPFVTQVTWFSLVTAVARDYEKILKPLIDSWHKRKQVEPNS